MTYFPTLFSRRALGIVALLSNTQGESLRAEVPGRRPPYHGAGDSHAVFFTRATASLVRFRQFDAATGGHTNSDGRTVLLDTTNNQ
ncbi:hypothetical protein GE09DRAFT_605300 [Coniochaeta sp. 2T2.1]|nr:hypothetical protein GE09DRAFT_605300 [Coniochaeta sp. 2T2.1]